MIVRTIGVVVVIVLFLEHSLCFVHFVNLGLGTLLQVGDEGFHLLLGALADFLNTFVFEHVHLLEVVFPVGHEETRLLVELVFSHFALEHVTGLTEVGRQALLTRNHEKFLLSLKSMVVVDLA